MKNATFLLTAGLALAATPAHAASITWSSAPYVHSGGPKSVMGIDQFDQSDDLFLAVNCGAGPATLTQSADPDIDFASSDARLSLVNLGSSFTGFHADNGTDNNLISRSGAYSGSPATVTLYGLTVGEDYRVQLYLMDGRGGALAGRYVEVDGIDQGTYSNGVSGSTWGDGLVVTGTFTADASQQAFELETFASGGTSVGSQLNAILVHTTAAPSTPLFWDGQNSGGLNGSSDEWDTTTANWNPAADFSGTATTWAPGSIGLLSGTGGAIEFTEAIDVGVLSVIAPGYSLTGATLGLDGSYLTNTEDFEIAATVSGGGDVAKAGAGRLTLSGDGSSFSGTLTNSEGELSINSPDWSSTGFTAIGGLLSFDHGGTISVDEVALDIGMVVGDPTRVNLTGGAVHFIGGGGWINTGGGDPGRLTSSSGTLTFNFAGNTNATPRLYVPLEDFDGGTPLAVTLDVETPASLRGPFDVYAQNTHTGGTTINNGRWQVRGPSSFGTGPVAVNDGGQIYVTGGEVTNDLTLAGIGWTESAGVLGALRIDNSGLVSGNVTVDPVGSRIVAYNGQNARVFGDLLGSGDLEINFDANVLANGIINLSGDNSAYTGTISVARGRLNLSGALGGSLAVADVGTAAVDGPIGGNLTLGDTGGIGGTLILDASGGALAMTDLTLNGNSTIQFAGLPSPGGPVPLFSYSGTLTDDGTPGDVTDNLTILDAGGYRQTVLSDTGSVVQVDLGNESSLFTADISDFWEIGGPDDNWSSSDGFFFNGDAITFDDTVNALFTGTVSLVGEPRPSSITIDNTSIDYTFAGDASNRIAGGASLLKSGTGTATFAAPNTFSGGTVIRAGTVQVQNAGGLGSGSVVLGDASTGSDDVALYLDTNRVNFTRPVTVSNNGTGSATLGSRATIGGAADNNQFTNIVLERDVIFDSNATDRTDYENIRGTGDITVTGAGRSIFVTSGIDWTGDLTIDGGLLQIGVVSGGGDRVPDATDVSLVNGGIIRLSTSAETIASLDGDASTTVSTNAPAGGIAVLTVGAGNTGGTFAGILQQGNGTLALTKTGTGTQVLSGNNTYLGATTVSQGVLSLAGPETLDDDGAVVITNGVLDLDFAGEEEVASLTLDGSPQAVASGTTFGASGSGADIIDDDNFSGTGLLRVGPSDPYLIYEIANNIQGAGPEIDSDGDGVANGVEFVVGGISDPGIGQNDRDLLPTFTDNGADVTFSFRLTDQAGGMSPAIWAVEFDTDLEAPWTTAVDPGNASISITPDAVEPWSTVEVTLAKPVEGRLFARLVVTLPAAP